MRKGYTVTYQMRKKQRQQREIVIQYVLKFVGVVLLAFLLVRFVCFSFTIQGDSMSPTIERGEKQLYMRQKLSSRDQAGMMWSYLNQMTRMEITM